MMFPLGSNSAFSFLLARLLRPGIVTVWQPWVILMCSTLMIQKQSKYLPVFMRRICLAFVATPSAVRCRYRYYSSTIWDKYFHKTRGSRLGSCFCVCPLVISSSRDGALLNKEVVVNNDVQLLDIRRCEELLPIWPGGAGADLKTRRVEVFNYNPLCGFRHHWPHFTIKTSS